MRTRLNFSVRSTSNWKLKVLVFEESGKLEYPSKTSRSKGENHQQTQPTFGADAGDLNPGHVGERRVLSPLRNPCKFLESNLETVHLLK